MAIEISLSGPCVPPHVKNEPRAYCNEKYCEYTIIMITKSEIGDGELVIWGEKYATGIEIIDVQHKELVNLTNQLYRACLTGEGTIATAFDAAMHRMVEYVHFHFNAELELLERIKYPMFHEHKKEHETLVRNVLAAVKDYNEGKKFIPNSFVRTLRDWVFGHIALSDKIYAAYVAEQKKKGLLTDQQING